MQLTQLSPNLAWMPQRILAQTFDYALSWNYQPLTHLLARQFGRPAGWLGRILGYTMSLEHRPVTEWTISLMDISPYDHILDVGCGAGMAIQLLAEAADQGFVAGIDYSSAMIQQASQRNRAAIRAGRVAIRSGNVARLPCPAATFDKVCAIETLYFWPDPLAGLQQIHRVLKPGGRVALALEFSKESLTPHETATIAAQVNVPIYSGAELVHLLHAAGFKAASFQAVPHNAHGWLYAQGFK